MARQQRNPPADAPATTPDGTATPDGLRAALVTLLKELPGWIKAGGARGEENYTKGIAQAERSQEYLTWLRGLPEPHAYQQSQIRQLEAGAAADRERLAELKKKRRRHEETTARLLAAERLVARFATAHQIDTLPLARLLAGLPIERPDDVTDVLLRLRVALDLEEEARPTNPAAGGGGQQAGPSPGGAESVGGPPAGAAIDKITQAIAIKQKHPGWATKKIAGLVGCSPSNLSQAPRWQTVCKAIRDTGREDFRREGKDRRAKDRGGRHRGRDMEEYADEAHSRPAAGSAGGPECASCGEPADRDREGKLLLHNGGPRCRECWEELTSRAAP